MTLEAVQDAAQKAHLEVFGALHCQPADGLPDRIKTLVLLGPYAPIFWPHFITEPEATDGLADPLDRWSDRVISGLAKQLDATAFFPFGGPPYQPFIDWAKRSGRAWESPVGLLVHDTAGLMVSYRGALGFSEAFVLPETRERPCDSCVGKPCLTGCPVAAMGARPYDVPACKNHLETEGNDCMAMGCRVRRICPVSAAHGRDAAQSAFHMRAFK